MRILLVLILFCAFLPRLQLLEKVAEISTPLQKQCADRFSEFFEYRHLARAFVCGTPIQNDRDQILFQQTGLIHLMVVSGGHLQMLALLLSLGRPPEIGRRRWLRWALEPTLLLYALISGFQPPVVRALLGRWTRHLDRWACWNWNQGMSQIVAGLFTLMLFPEWIHSLSFLLSWLASLGFLFAPLCRQGLFQDSRRSWLPLFLTCAMIQCFVALIFGNFSWLSLLANFFIAPLLAVILMIVTIPILGIPALGPGSNFFWQVLVKGLSLLESMAPPASAIEWNSHTWWWFWLILAALQSLAMTFHWQRYRTSDV